MPVTGKCPNIGNCEKADSKELLTVPDGPTPVCPECGTEVVMQTSSGKGVGKIAVVGAAAAVIVAALVYYFLPRPPVITGPQSARGTVEQVFEIRIEATNEPTRYEATGLPLGLSVDAGSGVISGIPTEAGTFSVILTATNDAGPSPAAPFTLTIEPPPVPRPVITSPLVARGRVRQGFEIRIEATNNPTRYEATGLPTGLTVNAGSGVISGTPTEVGTFSVTLTATNAAGPSPATTFTLTIEEPPDGPPGGAPRIISYLSDNGTVGRSYTYRIDATNQPTRYEAVGLPTGLALHTGSGVISGTPTAEGSFPVTLSATNAAGTGQEILLLTIAPGSATGPDEQRATARHNFQQGTLFVGLGRMEEAIKEFSAAIAADPDYQSAYANRGVAYITQKKYNKAFDDLTKAVSLNPKDKNAFYNLAVLYTLQKQFDRAIDYLEQAIKLNFRDADTLRSDPDLTELRKRPEFRKLIEQYGIPNVLKP